MELLRAGDVDLESVADPQKRPPLPRPALSREVAEAQPVKAFELDYRAGSDHYNINSVRGPILYCNSQLIFRLGQTCNCNLKQTNLVL